MKLKRLLVPLVLFVTLVMPAVAAKQPVDDAYLSDSIRSRLAADQIVKGGAIEVDVKDGVVTLKGKVEEEKQKSKAEKIAKKVNGVKSVDNQIVIVHPD